MNRTRLAFFPAGKYLEEALFSLSPKAERTNHATDSKIAWLTAQSRSACNDRKSLCGAIKHRSRRGVSEDYVNLDVGHYKVHWEPEDGIVIVTQIKREANEHDVGSAAFFGIDFLTF